MDRKQVTVVIPLYKAQPDHTELISLKQCVKILGHYPISVVCPEHLDITAYETECPGISFSRVSFPDIYFQSISGYNQLMLSPAFYQRFIRVKYILIYQLDAYVFRDELAYWCRQRYDYIGAPQIAHANEKDGVQFLKGYTLLLGKLNRLVNTRHQISNVGNGGLSLRNTRSCYWLVRLLSRKVKKWGTNNEDVFFRYWGNLLHPLFRLPADQVAFHFSIEQEPRAAMQRLGGQLPFGCHAFQRYDPEFWNNYFQFE
ncbi:MAG TPA: DUF5672 family protein [Mucilaginibacter sp.]